VRVAYTGPVEDGERLVAPMRRVGPVLKDTLGELSYRDVGSIHHEPEAPVAASDGTDTLTGFDEDAVRALLAVAGPDADAPFIVEVRQLGGAYAREPAVPNAVCLRDAAYTLFSAAPVDVGAGAHEPLYDALRSWCTGRTVLNFLGVADTAPQRVATAFTPHTYARLRQVKTAYDPANVFRLTHNIPPA
jgi:hypothetical protein